MRISDWSSDVCSSDLAYGLVRWRNVLFGMYFYKLARRKPAKVKARIIDMVQAELGPDYDVGTHFTPRYNPWDPRRGLVPDADLFVAIRAGRAPVGTATIHPFPQPGSNRASSTNTH